MKPKQWLIAYALALTAFTTYVAFDTFVIPEAYAKDATEINLEMIREETNTSEYKTDTALTEINKETESEVSEEIVTGISAENSSKVSVETDNNTDSPSVTVSAYRVNDTNVYVADIILPSVEYLKTAFAEDTYGRKITATTSDTAAGHNAILAINGDYYGARERGYVIRNGVLYRNTPSEEDVLCIYADGHAEIINPSEISAEELIEQGVWQAFSFGPGLIENGEISVDLNDEVGHAMASNPRTAIGLIDTNHFVFVVSDGRTDESEGLSLYELAEFMKELGVTTAYNLDGGGSSTMVYRGEVINNPTTNGKNSKERSVSDIVYIG